MSCQKHLILIILISCWISAIIFPHMAIGVEAQEVSSEYHLIEGKSSKIREVLSSIDPDKNKVEYFLWRIKKEVLKEYVPEIFSEENLRKYFDARKYSIVDKNGDFKSLFVQMNIPTSYDVYFIFFSKNDRGIWTLGDILQTNEHYYEPNPIYFRFENRDFISLRDSEGGTGVWTSEYHVYWLNENKLKDVLDYPSEGQRSTWGLPYDADFHETNLEVQKNQTPNYLEQNLTINYYFGRCGDEKYEVESKKIFSKDYDFRYFWDEKENKFKPKFEIGNEIDSPSTAIYLMEEPEKFLKTYFLDLKKVSANGDNQVKAWFECFLKECKAEDNEERTKIDQLKKSL